MSRGAETAAPEVYTFHHHTGSVLFVIRLVGRPAFGGASQGRLAHHRQAGTPVILFKRRRRNLRFRSSTTLRFAARSGGESYHIDRHPSLREPPYRMTTK